MSSLRFIILAYNVVFVDKRNLTTMVDELKKSENCNVYLVPHQDRNIEPIYCIFSYSEDRKENDK